MMTTVKREDVDDVQDTRSSSVRYVSFNGKGGSFVEWKRLFHLLERRDLIST